ncbi:unnamed protein product [Cunninghamella echinulata]
MDIPEELKYLAPYVQRGQELAAREPIVSYFAQYYAVKLAISKGPKKKTLGVDNEVITNDLVGYAHVENFALKVFLSADNEDRSGNASKKTAKTFLASSVFLELLKVFGEVDAEVEGKIKYAKWKAADIMKAIREGRTPIPGAPGENENIEQQTELPDLSTTADVDSEGITATSATTLQSQPPPSISDFPSPPANFTEPFSPSPRVVNNEDLHIPPPPTVTSSSSSLSVSPNISTTTSVHPVNQNNHSSAISPTLSTSRVPTMVATPTADPSVSSTTVNQQTIGQKEIEAAQKKAKWAISALNYDDVATARLQLLDALNELGFNLQNNFGY